MAFRKCVARYYNLKWNITPPPSIFKWHYYRWRCCQYNCIAFCILSSSSCKQHKTEKRLFINSVHNEDMKMERTDVWLPAWLYCQSALIFLGHFCTSWRRSWNQSQCKCWQYCLAITLSTQHLCHGDTLKRKTCWLPMSGYRFIYLFVFFPFNQLLTIQIKLQHPSIKHKADRTTGWSWTLNPEKLRILFWANYNMVNRADLQKCWN